MPPPGPPSQLAPPAFEGLAAEPAGSPADLGPSDIRAIVGAVNLAESIRKYGHMAAQLDPLGTPHWGEPSLAPEAHGISDAELRQLPATLVGGPVAERAANAAEAIAALRQVYSSRIGFDLSHIFRREERVWLRYAIESGAYRAPGDPIDEAGLLDRITQVEVFERFLHKSFPGKTRFSLEGLDMLVPVLDELIADAAAAGARHVPDRDGPSRPAEYSGPRAPEELRAGPGGVQGSARQPAVPGRPRLDR